MVAVVFGGGERGEFEGVARWWEDGGAAGLDHWRGSEFGAWHAGGVVPR